MQMFTILANSSFTKYLVYIPTVLFCLGIIIGMLTGFRRGLRKSVILLITMVISLILAFTAFFIVFGGDFDTKSVQYANSFLGAIGQGNLASLMDVRVDANASLSIHIQYFLAKTLPPEYFSQGLLPVAELLSAMAISIIKLISMIFVFSFYWIIKFILYILYLIFFKQKRHEKKVINRVGVYNKHRFFGMGVGAARGLVLGLLIFSFVGSLFYVLTGGNYADNKEELVIESDDKEYNLTEYYDIVNRYGSVGIGKLLESVKNKNDVPIYLLAADYILKSNYEVSNPDGTTTEGSLYGRRELGPIVGLVKNIALEALSYGMDFNQLNDTEYLLDFMSPNNVNDDNVAFSDRLTQIIAEYNLGSYTLYLGQCFTQSMIDTISLSFSEDSDDFVAKLVHILFVGEYSIKPKDLINNENVTALLTYSVDVMKNAKAISTLTKELDNSQELAFGIKKLNSSSSNITDDGFAAIDNVIVGAGNLLNSLTFFSNDKIDGLLSSLTIECVEQFVPDFSLDGIKEKDSIFSIYNINFKKSIESFIDTLRGFIEYVSDKDLKNTDELIGIILQDLKLDDSKAKSVLLSLVDNEITSTILNAKGVSDTINESFKELGITLPQSSEEMHYGNYVDSDGNVHKGEIDTLINQAAPIAYDIYTVFTDSSLDDNAKIQKLFDENLGLADKIASITDSSNTNSYSRLTHYLISNVLTDSTLLQGLPIKIYVPQSSLEDSSSLKLIKSSEISSFTSLIKSLGPSIFDSNADYTQFITNDNVNLMLESQLLKATLSIIMYDTVNDIEQFSGYIPMSLALDTDDNIAAHIDSWIMENGEIETIAAALLPDDVLVNLAKSQNMTDKELIELIFSISPSNIEKLLTANSINPALTNQLMTMEFDNGYKLVVPAEALTSKIDGLNRVYPNQIGEMFDVLIHTGLKDKLLADSENIEQDVLKAILELNSTDKERLSNSYIINATITKTLETTTFNSDIGEVEVVVPVEALQVNVSAPMLESQEFLIAFDSLSLLFDGNYDLEKLNYNRIFDLDVIESSVKSYVVSATVIKLLIQLSDQGRLDQYMSIPQSYKNCDLVNGYSDSLWAKNNELEHMLVACNSLDLVFNDDDSVYIDETKIIQLGLDTQKRNIVLDSDIMHITISQYLINFDGLTIAKSIRTISGDEEVIQKDEINRLLDAVVHIVGRETIEQGIKFNDLKTLVTVNSILKRDEAILDEILTSKVIYATCVDKFYSTEQITANLSIPVRYNLGEKTVLDNFDELEIVKDDELRKISKAVLALNIDLDNIEIDESILFTLNEPVDSESTSETKLTAVSESSVLWLTLSNRLLDSTTSVMTINVDDIKDYDRSEFGENYILVSEIENLLNAAELLGISDFTSNVDVFSLLELSNDNIRTICSSKIIWGTISKEVSDIQAINIPTKVKVNATDSFDEKGNYISIEEIQSVVNGVNMLNIETLEGFDINTFLSSEIDESVWNSSIIRYTVTNQFDTNDIIITDDCFEVNSTDIVSEKVENEKIIDKSEFVNFINAIQSINLTSINDLTIDFALIFDNVNTLLLSKLVRNAISQRMFEADQIGSIELLDTMTRYYIDDNFNVTSSDGYYIFKSTTILDYVNVAHSLGIVDYNISTNINVDYNNISIIANSQILRINLNDKILSLVTVYNQLNPSDTINIENVEMDIVRLSNGIFNISVENMLSDNTIGEIVAHDFSTMS